MEAVKRDIRAVDDRFSDEANNIEEDLRAFNAPSECRPIAYKGFDDRHEAALEEVRVKHGLSKEQFDDAMAQIHHEDMEEYFATLDEEMAS